MRITPNTVAMLMFCSVAINSLAKGEQIDELVDSTINYTDENGKRQGYWVFTNEMVNGECEDDEQKIKEGKYTNSRKNGIWKEYFCNENFKSKINYVNNRPNGYAIVFHENGNIKEEGEWKNNRWVGAYKLYYSNGNVQQEFNFNATGKRTGNQKYYYENGALMIEGTWSAGKESGIVTEYYENGDVRAIKDFAGGVLDSSKTQVFAPKLPIEPHAIKLEDVAPPPPVIVEKNEKDNLGKKFNGEGYWQLYNSDKQITKDGTFKRNRFISGKAYYYDEQGLLIRIAIYRNGKYVGDGIIEEEKKMH